MRWPSDPYALKRWLTPPLAWRAEGQNAPLWSPLVRPHRFMSIDILPKRLARCFGEVFQIFAAEWWRKLAAAAAAATGRPIDVSVLLLVPVHADLDPLHVDLAT